MEVLSMMEVEQIYNTLLNANITDKSAKKEHVKSIKSNVRVRKAKAKSNTCPRCGGDLVDRNGEHGKFIGCTNFPRCRYTVN